MEQTHPPGYAEAIVETIREPLLVLEGDQRVRSANRSFYRAFRVTPEQTLGRPLHSLGNGQWDIPQLRERLDRAVSHGERFEDYQFEHDFPLIGRRVMLLNARPVAVERAPALILLAIEDITERVRARQAAEQLRRDLEARVEARTAELAAANRELEAFSYSVSHDLRAPLRGIDGFSRILLEDFAVELPDAAQRYLNLIRRRTQEMGQLIDELLQFSRLSRHALHKQPVDMNQLAQRAIDTLAAERAERAVQIEVADLPPAWGDPTLLAVVMVNLVGNALKFTRGRDPARVEVAIADSESPAYHTYVVRDNGVGFDMRYVDRVFGVFQRLHRADEFEGTGVGLATVQRIIHRHGGRVWAEGAVDRGASIYFTLEACRE